MRGAGRAHETRTFTTTTKGLLQLRDWLASYQITLLGMESTGIYWRPVYYLLESDFKTFVSWSHLPASEAGS